MSKSLLWLLGLGVVALFLIIYGTTKYNSFVTQGVAINTQWAQVESQYQRRFDLIPNLVNSVKGIMKQEQTVFTAIADARTHYAGATTPDQKAAAAGEVESSLARLLVVMENYPQLKSADTVQSLMAELSGTENRVAVERMRYNDMVGQYNTTVQTFPGSIFASMFGFKTHTLFVAQEGTQTAPTVNI